MELENKSKNIKTTIALTSTLALLSASVGVAQQVKAEEASAQKNGMNTSSDETMAMPTTVEDARTAVATTEATLSAQNTNLSKVNAEIDATNKELLTLEAKKAEEAAALAAAQKTLETVSAVSEKEFTALVEKNKEELTTTKAQLQQNEAEKLAVASRVQKQTELVATTGAEAKKLAEQAAQADKKVSDLTKMVNQPEKITAQAHEAEKDLATTTSELAKAKANLTAVTEAAKKQLNQELATNQATLANKQAELTKLQHTATSTRINVVGNNKMVIPNGFPFAEIQKLMASGYIGSQSYLNAFNSMKDTLIARTSPGQAINTYVDIPSDLNRFVNIDQLTPEVQNELALFATSMINSVRQQLGLSQLIVSQGSQDFARYLTTSYKATHGNTRPFFNYGQAGVAGHRGIGPHDKTIIQASAQKVGLIPNDDNMYENLGFFDDVHTVNGIKRSIYNSVRYMLFTDYLHGNTLGHTVNFLRWDKTNPSAPVYLGVSTSSVGGLNTHYVVFPKTNIKNPSAFNQSLVSGPTITVSNASQINNLKTSIANLNTKISSLKQRIAHVSSEAQVVSAQNRVNSYKVQNDFAKTELAKLKGQLVQLKQSKTKLESDLASAKTLQRSVKAQLDQKLAFLTTAKAQLNTFNNQLHLSNVKVVGLVSKQKELQALLDFKNNPNRKEMAKVDVAKMQTELAATTAKLDISKNNLASLMSRKTRLLSAITSTEQQLRLLQNVVKEKTVLIPGPLGLTAHPEAVAEVVASKILEAKAASPVAALKTTEIKKEQVSESKTDKTANLVAQTTTELVKDALAVSPQILAGQGILAKVADNISKGTDSTNLGYGSGSTLAGDMALSNDESTKRAIRAGVVMLTAVGLTGFKLKKDIK
ncbi:SEC10/PgrA surface exclusion domain-containing protein [Streptococcus iniae]|uniref:Surface exclusion protein n=1 Tax=Streptococcus iniae TaxID=1346 RepID=A0ABN4DCV4_STRIN|nr:SEC10/PgrA surface exclusion domain-containing protein [Streptococcus iniae]AGM99664.1 hypothetical protein K710_1914 [Streptococcus iniae SF1]AHY16575.1 surface exclusion protein [Streptococcus iniae]AHY18441.1 surface exclusion protein [Streptococcus iniae]AJG26965.1 surface exclusion protein [Streptococcus iniae]APD32600.1 surface exclusion protein [Streptococcus iniae]